MNVRMERTMEKLLYELSLSFELPLCSSLFYFSLTVYI